MSKFNLSSILAFGTILGFSFFDINFISAQNTEFKNDSQILISLEFPDSPETAPPTSTVGGGRRAPACFKDKKNHKLMKALIPYNSVQTASSRPTFFVYIPQTSNKAKFSFSLLDEKSKIIDLSLIHI